jgi:hypothetical protein
MAASRKTIILVAVIAVIVVAGGVGAYFLASRQTAQPPASQTDTETTQPEPTYRGALAKTESQVTELVEVGDEQSIQQAEEIIAAQIATAEESNDEAYTVEARLAQAQLWSTTGRAQQALNEILLPFEQQYANDESLRDLIYAMISFAYKQLDDGEQAQEYLDKIPGKGWN